MQAANGSRKVKYLLNIVKWTVNKNPTADSADHADLRGSGAGLGAGFFGQNQSGICLQLLSVCVMLSYYFSIVYVVF